MHLRAVIYSCLNLHFKNFAAVSRGKIYDCVKNEIFLCLPEAIIFQGISRNILSTIIRASLAKHNDFTSIIVASSSILYKFAVLITTMAIKLRCQMIVALRRTLLASKVFYPLTKEPLIAQC